MAAEPTIADWMSLWRDNPAAANHSSLAIGWVLEASSGIVGYLGNVPQRYFLSERPLLAAAARGFAVDEGYRSHSLRLAAAFFSQGSVDLLLNTTANQPTASVFQLCKAERVPQADCDLAMFWITDAAGVAEAFLKQRQSTSTWSSVGAVVLGPLLNAEGAFRGRTPKPPTNRLATDIVTPRELNGEFEDLWRRTLKTRVGVLLADRSLETLTWHFGARNTDRRRPQFIRVRHSGRLAGYLTLTTEDSDEIGLKRCRVADLIVDNDDPEFVDALLSAAFDAARERGAYVLEVVGYPADLRSRFRQSHPHTRQLPSWPYWYKAIDRDLSRRLCAAAPWYVTPYDGDASL